MFQTIAIKDNNLDVIKVKALSSSSQIKTAAISVSNYNNSHNCMCYV